MAKQARPAKSSHVPSNLIKINRLGLPKCFTMDSHLAQHFSKGRLPHKDALRGGTTARPLTPEEVAWAQERERARRSREALQQTIAKIREERLEQLAIERNIRAVDMIRAKAL